MIDPSVATPSKKFLAKRVQSVFPGFALPAFIDALDVNAITTDKTAVEKIKKDPLRWHGGNKAGLAWLIMESCEIAQNNMSNLVLPLLVLQAEKDTLVVPEGAEMIVKNALSKDKEYQMYPDAFHQLLLEKEVKSDVCKKMLQWMQMIDYINLRNFVYKRTFKK